MPNKPNSMKTKHYILAIFAALVLASCYNDDKLWDAVNEQEQRIEALESWQKVVNSNIEALQTLVTGKHYITEVTPVTLEGKTVGYTIAFNDRAPITIYNGEKGEQGDKGEQGEQGVAGSTPVISITQQTDGNWYWTLNGELMKDANGKSIRANGEDGKDGDDGKPGEDGKDGQNAPTPVLKTGKALEFAGVSGTWTADAIYLSVDGSTTWTQVSGRNGTNGVDGDSFFSDVDTTSEDYVTFILSDGTKIEVPRYKALALSFSYTPAGGTETTINPARDILTASAAGLVIKYNVTGNGIVKDDVRVSAFLPSTATGEWTVSVDRDAKSVTIHPINDGLGVVPLLVTVTDNAGHSCTYELTLQTPYTGGEGTKDNPYKISSADELANLSEQVYAGNTYARGHFLLTNDLNLEGRNWRPIGRKDKEFSGSFDGGERNISNLFVDTKEYGGLFGRVAGTTAALKNITLLSPRVEVEEEYCGALVARCEEIALIENCSAKDIICRADSTVGGLVGYCYRTLEMRNCHVENVEVTGYNHMGGLIGIIYSYPNNTEIYKSSATDCNITCNGSWGHGGLVGTSFTGTVTLRGCYTTGRIYSSKNGDGDIAVGALLGQERGQDKALVDMKGSYSKMIIESADTPNNAHSLMGNGWHPQQFANCYYITSHTGQTSTTGITYQPGIDEKMIEAMNAELRQEDTYNTDGTFK